MDQPLADAPHPLAGVVNVEWSASPIYIARYRRDDDTILPGYLYIEDGVLHFVCSHVTSFKAETEPEDDAEADDEEEEKGDVDKKQEQQQQKRMIISTQNAKGLWFPDDTEDVVFELLDRETATIELLISDSEQFPLNKSVSWTHPSTHYMESLTPVVIRESIAGRVHLAWCMGKSGVYLGTQVEKSEVATYLEPGPNGTSIPTKTSSFLVMTGLEREWFLSNWTLPHPELEWRQANRPGRTGGIIVQFATSAGMLSISRSKSKNPVGLDFWPPGTIAPMSMLAHRPPRHDDNTKTHLGLDMASAQGDLDALRWWLDAGLPLEYSTNAVDKASAAGFTDVLQFWKDLGKPLRYTPAAIDDAAGNGQLASLQWWLDNYGKDMKFTTATIDNAARYNRMDVILWWTERELRFKYTNDALDFASQAGFIGVLDFFAQSGHKLKVSAFGVKQASYAGHIDVLSFWRKHLSDTEFRELTATCMDSATVADSVAVLNWFRDEGVWGYTSDAMDWAAKYNNVPLLQWWFDAGVPLKYSLAAYREAGDDVKEWWASVGLDWFTLPTPTAEQLAKVAPPEEEEIEALNPFDDGADDVSVLSLDSADVFKFQLDLTCRAGNVEAVKKWFESGDHTQYSEDALDYASYNESPAIVEMWFNSGLPLRYTHRTLNIASQEGHIEILRAWKASGNELLYTSYAMDSASASGHLHVLHWWMLSGLELLYTEAAMDRASGGDHLKVLEWWTRSGLPVMYSENALLLASANGCIQALTWWHESYFQLKYDRVACAVAATEGTHEKVLKWWHEYDEEPFPSDPIDAAILADNQYMVQWWLTRGNCAKWTATDMSDEVRAILDRYEDGTLSEIGSIHSEDDGEYERWQAANQLQADAAEEESDSGDESDGEYARWMAETKLAVAAMEAAGDGDSDEEDGDDDDKDDEDEAEAEEGQIELIVVGQETASKDVGVPLDEKFDAALAGVALAVEVLEQ
ncbi:hypothetical protein BC828DRAFT_271603 [Blastocladiella britannica]|nr:hypothetical protein BC828DRAFT_271603 [Blastocladiella britannica]